VYSCSIPYLPFARTITVNHKKIDHFGFYDKYLVELCIPGLLSGNLRVAEDLGGVVPLVGGNWLASWGVAIAHDLQVKRIQ
jgi:hypothetical protein